MVVMEKEEIGWLAAAAAEANSLDGIGGAVKYVDSGLKHGVSPPRIAFQRS